MKRFTKILKVLRIAFSTILSSIFLYLIFSFIFSIIPIRGNIDKVKDVVIFIRTNGVHTDFVLPIRYDSVDWSKKVPFSNTLANDSMMNYIAFGWGDKAFYLNTPNWSDLKFSTAFNAIFGLGESAVHITYIKHVTESKNSIKIEISKRQYNQLVKYIEGSFDKTANGEFVNIKTNMVYNRNDSFYEGRRNYSLFYTCNTWTNCGLKECELKSCFWTPFDKGIFFQYRKD